MSSKKCAQTFFANRRLNSNDYVIGHLKDEIARLYARDLYLIGYCEESEILSQNDISRYTAVIDKETGNACGVFFDLPAKKENLPLNNVRKREVTSEVSY